MSQLTNDYEVILNKINKFPLEMNEGTKRVKEKYHRDAVSVRNDALNKIICKYKNDLNHVKKCIQTRADKYISKLQKYDSELHFNKLLLMKKVLKQNNYYNDTFEKLDLDDVILGIDSGDLVKVNDMLLTFINVFKKAGINLENNDFDYSPSTYEYMSSLIKNYENENFNVYMRDIFEQIYWNCPNILEELKQNIKFLIRKYDKKLNKYSQKIKHDLISQAGCDEFNYEDVYKKLYNDINVLERRNTLNNLNLFLTNSLKLEDYLPSSINRNNKFSKYCADFISMTAEDKNKFYLEINSLKDALYELKIYNSYNYIIKDIISKFEPLKSKDEDYLFILKKIDKHEKLRMKYMKKYFKCKNNSKNDKKISELKNNINKVINELNNMYKSSDEALISYKVRNYLNKNSSVYDALFLAGSFKHYLIKTISKNIEEMTENLLSELLQDYDSFMYNPNILILKKLRLFDEVDIKSLILQKFRLVGVTLSDEYMNDLNTIENDIELITKVYDIENGELSFEQIAFICEAKK